MNQKIHTQYTNLVTIDPSLLCTAMIINGEIHVFASSSVAWTEKDNLKKWFGLLEDSINLKVYKSAETENIFSVSEINKLKRYDEITDDIVSNIPNNSDVYIEGYSQGSNAGHIIDLVTFGTLLRSKISKNPSNRINIITPLQLKSLAAQLTYQPSLKKKSKNKLEYRNNEGVIGGKFTKIEMLKVLIENPSIVCDYVTYLRTLPELLSTKTIPKPIEDINDAKIMFYVAQKILDNASET